MVVILILKIHGMHPRLPLPCPLPLETNISVTFLIRDHIWQITKLCWKTTCTWRISLVSTITTPRLTVTTITSSSKRTCLTTCITEFKPVTTMAIIIIHTTSSVTILITTHTTTPILLVSYTQELELAIQLSAKAFLTVLTPLTLTAIRHKQELLQLTRRLPQKKLRMSYHQEQLQVLSSDPLSASCWSCSWSAFCLIRTETSNPRCHLQCITCIRCLTTWLPVTWVTHPTSWTSQARKSDNEGI